MHFEFIAVFTFIFLPLLRGDELGTEIILGTCCKLQNQFLNDTCATTSESFRENKPFGKFLSIPGHLLPSKFGNSSTRFRLTEQPIFCPNGSYAMEISLSSEELIVDGLADDGPLVFSPSNGFLKYRQANFYPEDYCFNRIDEKSVELLVCKADCSELRPCITKCCDIDEVWEVSRYPDGPLKCSPAGDKLWAPMIYSSLGSKEVNSVDKVKPHIITSHPKFWCTASPDIHALRVVSGKKKELFKILRDGSIWLKLSRTQWTKLSPGTLCIDGAKSFPGDSSAENGTTSYFSGDYTDTVIVDCGSEYKSTCIPREATDLYGIALVIASIFLLVTVIVYILLWEKQNIHGWTSLSYFTSLFFMYIFTALVRFSSDLFTNKEDEAGAKWECHAIAICTHFFWISTFCWMTSVNFDLWWTFRALMPTGSKSKGVKRFLMYVTFSNGIPFIIVGTGVLLDHIYGDDLESDIIIPEYSRKNCYMNEELAPLPYVYGPIAVLLMSNLIFFTVTVYDMYKIQQSTKFAAMSSSKNSQQKQSMKLFAKLFLLMGIPWIFEVISWAISPCGEVPWYWVIFDLINIFQAVAIFFTFVCKLETRNALEFKFPAFKRFMMMLSIRPDKADAILERRPGLKFLIKPFTRSRKNLRAFASGKTISTFAESSVSTRSRVDRNFVGN